MADGSRRDWRELCVAALHANDSEELLTIVRELNDTLALEERLQRDSRAETVAKEGRPLPRESG